MANARLDQNRKASLLGVSNSDGVTPVILWADPVTHRLLVDISSSITGADIAAHLKTDQYTSTNNQTQFTATRTVVADMLVIVNGQVQSPGGGYDYTISGNILTLTQGIPAGLQVLWKYIY